MSRDVRIVDNRVFLLGLDGLYREAMKRHECDELLNCARETASALAVVPADVPIDGYYGDDPRLTEYFQLVRALQKVPKDRESEVSKLGEFMRLKQVMEAPIFGALSESRSLFAGGQDPLSVALERTFPAWTVEHLTSVAYTCAAESSDFSLVALAALSRDAVVLTALRESVVLYSMAAGGGIRPSEPEYIWTVDEIVQQRAVQFVETFNELFGENLPSPGPDHAKQFWAAAREWAIIGRCVRIGFDDSVRPIRHYHWAIDWDDTNRSSVRDFWDTEIWTTDRYRAEQEERERFGSA